MEKNLKPTPPPPYSKCHFVAFLGVGFLSDESRNGHGVSPVCASLGNHNLFISQLFESGNFSVASLPYLFTFLIITVLLFTNFTTKPDVFYWTVTGGWVFSSLLFHISHSFTLQAVIKTWHCSSFRLLAFNLLESCKVS